MKKRLAILLSLLLLLSAAGCSSFPAPAPPSSTIPSQGDQETEAESFQALYESAEAQKVDNIAHYSFGLNESLEAVETDSEGWVTFSYTGEPIQIPYYVANISETVHARFGLLAFVNGYPQPWYLADVEGNSISEVDYMQKFDLAAGEEQEFYAVLDPISGVKGETVGVLLAAVLEPDYVPEATGYGIYYSVSATVPYQIRMEADGSNHLNTDDQSAQHGKIPEEEQLRASNEAEPEDFMRDNRRLSLLPLVETDRDTGSIPFATLGEDLTVHLTFSTYWGADASYLLTLYVNNRPVSVNGADCVFLDCQPNQLVTAELELDLSGLELEESETIYGILIPTGEDYMRDDIHITEPLQLEVKG